MNGKCRRLKLYFWMVVGLLLLGLLVGAEATRGAAPPAGSVTPRAWAATEGGAVAEVWVVLDQQVDLPAPTGRTSKAARGRQVYETLWAVAQERQAPLRRWMDRRGVSYQAFYIVNAFLVQADRDLLQALALRPDVERVVTNPKVAMDLQASDSAPFAASPFSTTPFRLTPDDANSLSLALPWGIEHIGAPEVWDLGIKGEGIVVAGQDTGYAWRHPALQSQYRGWDGVSADHDYNWHDAIHAGGGACGPDATEPCDDHWHGTHTMGTIVGDDGASHQVGVAPGARWIGCRNMSQGVGSPATYAECFQFFLAPYPLGGDPSQGDPALAPDVVNNSWGCPPSEGCDAVHIWLLELAVERLRGAGIVVVSSAGNHGSGCGSVDEPSGMYDAVYTVGATAGTSDAIAAFSSRGTGTALIKPDIVAPGVSVLSSVPGGGYSSSQGTSMAAPHVTGALALLWSARPDLRGQVGASEAALNGAAVPYASTQCGDVADAVPNNVYGWGRLDILEPVQAAVLPPVFAEVKATAIVSEAMSTVTASTLYTPLAELSGMWPITVGGEPYTLTTRYSLAPEAIAVAEGYAQAYFEGLGLPTTCHTYTLEQETRCNIIAEQRGILAPDRVVLLSAHLDSTSRDDPLTLAPGADDNASGVASAMVVAAALRPYDLPYTVRYALFTGEEQGLHGSTAYAQDVAAAGEELVAVLNLDMVGYNSADQPQPTMQVHTRQDEAGDWAIARVFTEVVATYGLDLVPLVTPTGLLRSDHAPFWEEGYAAVLASEDFADFNPYYHSSQDRLEMLDMAYVTAFARAATGAAMHLGGVVDFVHQPVTVGLGSPVTFTVVSHLAYKPLAYAWDFGAGVAASGDQVSHTFTLQDTQLRDHEVVTLTVVHAAGSLSVAHPVPVLSWRVYLPLAVRP